MSGSSFKRARRAIRPVAADAINQARQDILNAAPWWRAVVYRWGWKEPLTTWCRKRAAKAERVAEGALKETARKVVRGRSH